MKTTYIAYFGAGLPDYYMFPDYYACTITPTVVLEINIYFLSSALQLYKKYSLRSKMDDLTLY